MPADPLRSTAEAKVFAGHYRTGDPVLLRWRDGVITGLKRAHRSAAPRCWLAPLLVDLQVNGFAGVDFQQDSVAPADLFRAVAGLRAAGCGRFLLTLVTDHWNRLLDRLQRLKAIRDASSELSRAIAGWHLEGPFLSTEPGFCGAHDPALMRDPSRERMRELREIVGHDPVLLTLAPERRDAPAAIAEAAALGFKVSLGHTDASAELLQAAVRAGATGFTHLGNACPQLLDRHNNILWRALDIAGLTYSLIPDGKHVSPTLFRLIHRAVPRERIFYVTDAMSAAGAPPGRHKLGQLEVEVGVDQTVRQPGRTNFAGSSLRAIDGVFRAAEMLECPWAETWDAFSVRPARFMGLPGGLEVGLPADFCLVKFSRSRRPLLADVYLGGKRLRQRLDH